MNKIIVFGNQKGGVGKTTLCTLFANYLTAKNVPVLVVDCDSQQTIFEKRKQDLSKHDKTNFRYNIQPFSITDDKSVELLMTNLRKMDGVILIDSPGHLAQQGLVPLFSNSDFVVCPYQYEATCVNSTIKFIVFLAQLKQRIKNMKSQLIFVPNKYDSRVGRKKELELWKKTEDSFGNYGENAPKIKAKIDLQRYNTIVVSEAVQNDVCPTFDFIYTKIFNKDEER